MGAVAGIYCLDGREAPAGEVESMLSSLAHRGPDGKGVWAGGPVALGQRTLATIPEAVGRNAPFADRGLVVVADARIDNRGELVSVLGLRPSACDGELIAAAYEAWREDCADRLVGDFAFCLWDSARGALFCARDPFGIRPLHYSFAPGRAFALASEIKALLPRPEVSAAMNQAHVARFLDPGLGDQDPGSTFYEDVQRLPAGHTVLVRPGGISLRRYWGIEPLAELRLPSDEAYAEVFRETFYEAVRCRLRGPAPVGVMLSGGLDSSSIACVARALRSGTSDRPLPTFSLDFETPGADERAYVDAVLAGGGLQPHRVDAEALSPQLDIDRFHRFADEPSSHLAYLPWALYEAAAALGVRVLMDGGGGDQILSHTRGYFPGLARSGRWITLGREVDAEARRRAVARRRILWHDVLKPAAPGPVRTLRRRLRARATPASRGSFLHAELAARFAADGPARSLPAGSAALRELGRQLPAEAADRVAAAFSLEPRYPFWDRRLAEYALALPGREKLRRGVTKVVLRSALLGTLPPEVSARSDKSTPAVSFARNLLRFEQDRLDVLLGDPPAAAADGFVDVAALRAAYRSLVGRGVGPGASAEYSWLEVAPLWRALNLLAWLATLGAKREERANDEGQGQA